MASTLGFNLEQIWDPVCWCDLFHLFHLPILDLLLVKVIEFVHKFRIANDRYDLFIFQLFPFTISKNYNSPHNIQNIEFVLLAHVLVYICLVVKLFTQGGDGVFDSALNLDQLIKYIGLDLAFAHLFY